MAHVTRTSRGGRHKASRGVASPGWLARIGDIEARGTSPSPRDESSDDQGQAGASGCRVTVSSLVLTWQAQARSPEASGKGFHIGATRPRPAGRQDGGNHGAHDGVTTRAFGRRRPPFVRIACTSCPLQIWLLWDSFPLNIWEEDPDHYNRTSHHHWDHFILG